MKILCVCSAGNCRSTSLAWILREDFGLNDVLVAGVDRTSPETFAMMANWADRIYAVADKIVRNHVPKKFDLKIVWWDIGLDRWFNPRHPELVRILSEKAQEERNQKRI